MVRIEIPNDVCVEVGQARSQWETVDRGLFCVLAGTICTLAGMVTMIVTPLLMTNMSARNYTTYGSVDNEFTASVAILGIGLGVAATAAGGILVMLGACFCCASPQPTSRTMAVICVVALLMIVYMTTSGVANYLNFAMWDRYGPDRDDFTTRAIALSLPANLMGFAAHVAMISFLYMVAGYLSQKNLTKRIFAYGMYLVGVAAGIPLLIVFNQAFIVMAHDTVGEYGMIVIVLQAVIGLLLVIIGMAWYVRMLHATRAVVSTALQHAAAMTSPTANRQVVEAIPVAMQADPPKKHPLD